MRLVTEFIAVTSFMLALVAGILASGFLILGTRFSPTGNPASALLVPAVFFLFLSIAASLYRMVMSLSVLEIRARIAIDEYDIEATPDTPAQDTSSHTIATDIPQQPDTAS